jgi:hypothetical protein
MAFAKHCFIGNTVKFNGIHSVLYMMIGKQRGIILPHCRLETNDLCRFAKFNYLMLHTFVLQLIHTFKLYDDI